MTRKTRHDSSGQDIGGEGVLALPGADSRAIFREYAPLFWEAGLSVVPVRPGTKHPAIDKWESYMGALPSQAVRDMWCERYALCNIGVLAQIAIVKEGDKEWRLGSVDCDRDEFVRAMDAMVGASPSAKIGKKGKTSFVLYPKGMKIDYGLPRPNKDANSLGRVFDIVKRLHVVPPSEHPDTRQPYRWIGRSLNECDLATLPRVEQRQIDLLRVIAESENVPALLSGIATHDAALRLVGQLVAAGATNQEIERIVRALLPLDYETIHDDRDRNTLDELSGMVRDARAKGFDQPKKPSQASVLVGLVTEQMTLFHTPAGTSYAEVQIEDRFETWPVVNSKQFGRWLRLAYWRASGGTPSNEAMSQAVAHADALAQGGDEREVSLRAARHEGKIYIDLCDRDWRVVEVDEDGWRVISRSPAKFHRMDSVAPLPEPIKGGNIDELRPFLNLDDDGFVLAIGWLLTALGCPGPYFGLALYGEAGSAKTTAAKMLRALVDPNMSPLRRAPHEQPDVNVAARNSYVVAFNNVSRLPWWLSDALASLLTEGGAGTRQFYTNDQECVFPERRPVILNGIESFITAPDLADRTIVLLLERIDSDRRREEAELLAEFEEARPGILGALLDAMSHGLRTLPTMRLERLPRMADACRWVTACEGALWTPGEFLRAYELNTESGQDELLGADILGPELHKFMGDGTPGGASEKQRMTQEELNPADGEWIGTLGKLLGLLTSQAGAAMYDKRWPKTERQLSDRLRVLAPVLRRAGIEATPPHRTTHKEARLVRLKRTERYEKRGTTMPGTLPRDF